MLRAGQMVQHADKRRRVEARVFGEIVDGAETEVGAVLHSGVAERASGQLQHRRGRIDAGETPAGFELACNDDFSRGPADADDEDAPRPRPKLAASRQAESS